MKRKELLADLNLHTGKVLSAVFSHCGTRILAASDDKTAKLWDLNGNLLAELNMHMDDVNSAVFPRTAPGYSRHLLTAPPKSDTRLMRLWNG